MALQSQAPRAGTGRRYTTASKSKKGLTPWLALLGVAVIVGGLIILFAVGEDPTKAANAASTDANASDTLAPQPSAAQAAAGSPTNPTPPTRPLATPGTNTGTTTRANQANPQPTYTGPAATHDPARAPVGQSKDQYKDGMALLEAGDIVNGRKLLSELLFRDGSLSRDEAREVRGILTQINTQHVFNRSQRSAEQIAADPIVALHKVQSGEYLGTIANTYRTPYQLIERINNIDARKLQAGQALQVLNGPVHARIDKSDYRMDLFVYDDAGLPIFLKSYTVGLGEFDSTPIGQYRIKPGSKVGPDAANGKGPSWRNPRTGKVYASEDPDIPIGEYWMALEGTDENTKGKDGYGIHATNDPASIGRQESMGCIRMRDEDVDEVFYTLFEGASTVQIVP